MSKGPNRFLRLKRRELPLALTLLAAFPTVLHAQDTSVEKQAEAAEEAKPASQKAERIEIVGSRIKRTEVETSSAVRVIDRKQIEATGATSLGELIRGDSTTTLGNFSGANGYVRAGAQSANLYGLGAGRTLVLLDGERLPRDASLQGTNLNLIPASAIERVEILSGGRSAVYGSDAVAGVINFVTRKDLRGNAVETMVRAPEDGGGNKISTTVSSAFSLAGANVILGGGYERDQRIYRKNREIPYGEGKFANSQAAQPIGTFNYRVTPAGGRPNLWQPSPNCPEGNISDLRGPGQPDRGMFCVGDTAKADDSELLPSQEGGFFSTRISRDVGNASNLNAFATYTQHNTRANAGNFFTNYNYLNARRQILPAATANALGLGIEAPEGSSVEFYKIEEHAPERITYNKDQSYGGFLKFETPMGEWNSDFSVTHYTTENHRDVDNVIDKVPYSEQWFGLAQDPTTLKLNPVASGPTYIAVDPNRNPAAIGSMVQRMSAAERNGMTAVGANFGRELGELPGGAVAINLGIDSRVETFNQTPDPKDTEFFQGQPRFTGTESTRGRGDRAVNSTYAEAVLPILKPVTVDAALRYDNYSDFGSATNYNYGVKYRATDFLTFRHSGGTSFRAPELNNLHQVGGGGYQSIRDEAWCRYRASTGTPCIEGETHSIFVDRPGNKDLKAEKGRSWSAGVIVEPTEDIYLSADYLAFSLQDVFTLRTLQDIVDDWQAGKGSGMSTITTDGENGYITTVARPWENISRVNLYMVQLEAGAKEKVGTYELGYRTNSTNTISRRDQQSDGSMKQYAGYEGVPKWRWNNFVTIGKDKTSLELSSHTISRQHPDPDNDEVYDPVYFNDQVDEFTLFNAAVAYDFSSTGHLVLGAVNLANKMGGVYRTGNFTGAVSTDSSMYASSWYGRSYFATVSQKF